MVPLTDQLRLVGNRTDGIIESIEIPLNRQMNSLQTDGSINRPLNSPTNRRMDQMTDKLTNGLTGDRQMG